MVEWNWWFSALGAAISGAAATVFGLPAALAAIGFTAGGVAGSSIAAAWQASLGNVAASSLFAVLQSIGAAGLGMMGLALLGLGGAATAVGIAILVWMFLP